jgi:hypothetical protein
MRVLYFMIFVYLIVSISPVILDHGPSLAANGVRRSMLLALGLLMGLGIRYPVRMLPILLFELAWKTIWTLAVGGPLWRTNQMDADTMDTAKACVYGVLICLVVIPWGYVWRHYVKESGDRWRVAARST